MGRTLGLFGGSFDPPHRGHRALVETARDVLGLDEIWVIPAGKPVHRTLTRGIDAHRRLRWVQALLADVPGVCVQDWEIRAAYPVPTIDTLRRVQSLMPTTVPVLLMGMDAWAAMASWQAYPQHRALCNVAVFFRQGIVPVTLADWQYVSLAAWPRVTTAGHVVLVERTLPDVSATMLRRKLRQGDRSFAQDVAADYADELRVYYAGEDT